MLQAAGEWLATANLYVVVVALLTLSLLEVLRPKRQHRLGFGVRWTTNIGLHAINTTAANLLLPLAASTMIGQVWTVPLPWTGSVSVLLFGFLALDLHSYAMHRLEHAVLLLWRLHVVHHADAEMDVSTALRHHPAEAVFATAMGLAVITVLGLPDWVVAIYAAVAITAAAFQHANVGLPPRLDAWLRSLIVTPALHEVHHSSDRRDHDTNYGMLFSFWDRLFGTYRSAPALGADGISFGVKPLTPADVSALHRALLLPLTMRRRCAADANGTVQADGTVTPIMSPARTSPASRASSHPSVPAGC